MGEVIGVLLVAGFFVMLIGHGMWLIAAAIFRGISGDSSQPSGTILTLPTSPAQKLYELQRHVIRLRDEGVINAEQHQKLLDVIHQEQAKQRLAPVLTPVKPSPPSQPVAHQSTPSLHKEVPTELVFDDDPAPPVKRVADDSKKIPPVVPAAPPVQPSEPLTHVLQAFMEQRNIRWGEIISGLLIVGSSIGLVVSLWSTLSQVAYFPALLFLLATAAIHGAGIYTLRKWKLRSTSRGLLVITGLLIPLNYLAAIALSQQRPVTDPFYIASVAIGTLAFAAMAWSGGRILLLRGTVPYLIALLGTSTGQLLIARQVTPDISSRGLLLMTALPFVCYLFALVAQLRQAIAWPHFTWRRIGQVYLLLGVSTFALFVSLGLVVWKFQDLPRLLSDLSPILNVALIPVLGLGLVIHNRALAPSLVKYQTAGTTIAFLATALMLGTLAAAWPHPELLILIGVIDFAALSLLAVRAQFSLLHVAAAAVLALAGLLGFHVASGTLDTQAVVSSKELFDALVMGRSSVVLTVFSIIAAVTASGLYRLKKTEVAVAYGYTAAGLAIVSVAIAVYAGFLSGIDRDWTTLVFALSAVVLLAANLRIKMEQLAWVASGFVLMALVHALDWNTFVIKNLTLLDAMPDRPLVFAFLLHATFGCATAIGIWRQVRPTGENSNSAAAGLWHEFAKPLSVSAMLTSAIMVPRILVVSPTTLPSHAGYGFWVAVVWLGLAYLWQSRWGFAAAQALATVALGFVVTSVCRDRAWWEGAYLDPRHLQAQMAVLAAWGMLLAGVRWLLRGVPQCAALWKNSLTTVDRALLGVFAVASVLMVTAACVPGLDVELRRIPSVAGAVGIHPLLIAATILITVGLVVAASLAMIPKRRIAAFSGLSVLTAAWALPVWDDVATHMWNAIGVSHAYAYNAQAWLVFGVLVSAIIVAMWERFSMLLTSGLLFLTMTVPLLIAAQFDLGGATATVLRWGLAVHAIAIAAIVCGRRYWWPVVQRLLPRLKDPLSTAEVAVLRSVALTLTLTPLLALTLRHIVLLAAPGSTVAVPAIVWGSFKVGLLPAWSFGVPLVLMAAVFGMYAIRERSSHFAIAGSLMLNLAVSVALILVEWAAGTSFAWEGIVTFLQWNAVVSAACAVTCLLARRRIESLEPQLLWSALWLPAPLEFLVLLSSGLTALLATWAAAAIIAIPVTSATIAAQLGGPLSYVALTLVMAAGWFYYRRRTSFSRLMLVPIGALSATTFIAASFERLPDVQPWGSYHVLISGWSAISVLLAAISLSLTFSPKWRTEKISTFVIPAAVGWSVTIVGFVVLLAVRGLWHLPAQPWWSTIPVGIAATTLAALALRGRDQRFAYDSTLLAALATSFLWLTPWVSTNIAPTAQSCVELLEACLLALVAAGVVWLGVEIYWQRRKGSTFDTKSQLPPVHHAAAGIGLMGTLALTAFGLLVQHSPDAEWAEFLNVSNLGAWWLLAVLGGLLLGVMWDTRAQHIVVGLYTWGIAATGLVLYDLDLSTRHLIFGSGIAAGSAVLLSGAFWKARGPLCAGGRRLRIAHTETLAAKTEDWLPMVSLVQTAVCVLIGLWVVITFAEMPLRLYATAAVAMTALGIVAFAHNGRTSRFQLLALLLAAVAAVDLGWAMMDISTASDIWLHRAIRLLEVVAVLACAYGSLFIRWLPAQSQWFHSMRTAGAVLMSVTVAALLSVLALEADLFVPGQGVPVTNTEIVAVVVVLTAFIAALISMAVLPGRDPLGLSETGRMFYVYAAEVVMALLFLQVYLAKPEWFHGRIRPYWPLIVMAIAFFGVGAGEILRRSKIRVLAKPLEQTGTFLPLLPALGFSLLASRTDYSTVLFVVGLLYVLLSMLRHQLWQGIAAAVAGNAGLWALWHEQGTGLFEHPQLWMIPPALSVLAAAQWHRSRLGEAQLTAMRYASILVIYVSSTGDMFITGIADNLWMPVILAALSIAGVFAGIMLRVRAFIYLGTSFLFVSIVSMIWHAAQSINHIWPWWAFGIVMGLLILTMFGVFEKKRQDVLRLVGQFRQWDA